MLAPLSELQFFSALSVFFFLLTFGVRYSKDSNLVLSIVIIFFYYIPTVSRKKFYSLGITFKFFHAMYAMWFNSISLR